MNRSQVLFMALSGNFFTSQRLAGSGKGDLYAKRNIFSSHRYPIWFLKFDFFWDDPLTCDLLATCDTVAVKLLFHLVSFTLQEATFSVVFLLALSPMVGQHKPFKDSELRKIAHWHCSLLSASAH